MSKTAKILVTIGAIVGFLFLFAILVDSRDQSGQETPGIFGIILLFSLIAGIRAIWKSPESNDKDDMKLDKN